MTTAKFTCLPIEREQIQQIVKRASGMQLQCAEDYISLEMDLEAVHCNDVRINFEKLMDADNFNFTHDVSGIANNIDRTTGKLMRCFSPRCARND